MQNTSPGLVRLRALKEALSKEAAERKTRHTIGELFQLLEPLELAMGGIFFSAPFLQPVPLPGLSTPVGVSLSVLAFLTMIGKGHMALPRRLRDKSIDTATVQKILAGAEKILLGLSKIPHWEWGRVGRVLSHPRTLSGHVVFMALLLSLPLPIPFSNSIPAWGVVFACLAMIEANGIFILLSYVTLVANVVFFGGLIVLAMQSL